MAGLLDMVLSQLGSGGLGAVAGQLGTSPSGAKPSGAQALDSALAKDHDGSIFDNLGGFLDGAASGPGAGILGHVLGGSRPQVEQKIAETSGLSLDKVAPLLITVAPLVMGALGKLKRDKNLDATAVADTLATERKAAQDNDGGNVLSSVLGMLGGMTQQPAGAPTESPSGGGGLLGMLGGLFGKKKGS